MSKENKTKNIEHHDSWVGEGTPMGDWVGWLNGEKDFLER